MATFTTTLSPDETKAGMFLAVVSAGATITLTADSAAHVHIFPCNIPTAGGRRKGTLSVDNNEGLDGDAAEITPGATTWTVPGDIPSSDGVVVQMLVSWRAYNWSGPGSMTIEGFDAIITDSEEPIGESIKVGCGGRIAFPPEGGVREIETNIPGANIAFVNYLYIGAPVWGGAEDWLKKNLTIEKITRDVVADDGTTSERVFLRISTGVIPPDNLRARNFRGWTGTILVRYTGQTPAEIELYAGYFWGNRNKNEQLTIIEQEGSAKPEGISTYDGGDILSVAPKAETIIFSDTIDGFPGGPLTCVFDAQAWKDDSVEITCKTAGNGLKAEIYEPPLLKSSQLSQSVDLSEEDSDTSFLAQKIGNEQTTEATEVIIEPKCSPRSAMHLFLLPNNIDDSDSPVLEFRFDSPELEFSHYAQFKYALLITSFDTSHVTIEIDHKNGDGWLNFEYTGGTANYSQTTTAVSCKISVLENTGHSTRKAIVVARYDNGAEERCAYLEIIQLSKYEAPDPHVSALPGNVVFPAVGGTQSVSIQRNYEAGPLSVLCNVSWLVSTKSGLIQAEENTTGEERTGTVFYSGENGGGAMVNVTQAAYADNTTAELRVEPLSVAAHQTGGLYTVNVETYGDVGEVLVSCDADWLMATADGKIFVKANTLHTPRKNTITFRAGNLPEEFARTVSVSQAAARRAPAMFYRGLLAVGF